MLLFIGGWPCESIRGIQISKHRMLLFIERLRLWQHSIYYFKTSYVTVYRRTGADRNNYAWISKHRMLLFIGLFFSASSQLSSFQNIVCYCLSTPVPLSIAALNNFKTSYVTVYRIISSTLRLIGRFQNIVCYYLSILLLLFRDFSDHFKTSYVTVYRDIIFNS